MIRSNFSYRFSILALTVTLVSGPGYLSAESQFNYARYTPKTIETITNEIAEHHSESPGLSFYTEFYRVQIDLPGYPSPASADELSSLRAIVAATSFGKENATRFGSVLRARSGNVEIVYLFQDVLIPYLRQEIKIGQPIELYLMLGIVESNPNSKSIKLTLLVNEFKSIPKSVPMIEIIKAGKTEELKQMLSGKLNLEVADEQGLTPLMWAAILGKSEIISLLLERGAKSDARSTGGFTAFYLAAGGGHLESMRLLNPAKNVKVVTNDGSTPLHTAVSRGHIAVVRYLLDNGADLHRPDHAGNDALILACAAGHEDIALFLLERGASTRTISKSQENALIYAADKGLVNVTNALILAKVDVNLKSDGGLTAIYWAAQSGHPEIIKILLAASADGRIARDDGVTPIMIAAKKGHLDVIKLLIQAGCDPWVKAGNGITALEIARAYKQAAAAQYLENLAGEN